MRAGYNKKPREKWSESEINFLRENYKKYSIPELAEMLGRTYSGVHYEMKRQNLILTEKERKALEKKRREAAAKKLQDRYVINDREVEDTTLTAVAGAVYHGTRAGKKLDDILIEHAADTHRSVEVIRKIYEENKGRVEMVKRQWESFNAPQDRSIAKNRRNGHLPSED